jgi:hypothetical protein
MAEGKVVLLVVVVLVLLLPPLRDASPLWRDASPLWLWLLLWLLLLLWLPLLLLILCVLWFCEDLSVFFSSLRCNLECQIFESCSQPLYTQKFK